MNYYLFKSVFEFQDSTIVDWLTFAILTLTLIVLSYYTFCTRKLQKAAEKQSYEMSRQRRLSISPSLIHIIKDSKTSLTGKGLFIKNIGNGPAINISLKKVKLPYDERCCKIEGIDILQPGEEIGRMLYSYTDEFNVPELDIHIKDLIYDPDQRYYLKKDKNDLGESSIDIEFEFQDIEGNIYRQTNKIIESGYLHGIVVGK